MWGQVNDSRMSFKSEEINNHWEERVQIKSSRK